ncbi:hypothetical protein [Sedimentisphaera salicampi]|uniref:Uncharacterized protein n=1 Tax=Sedimentisphaera salicampi TaxID=1941349 RepID=A0A1W6LMK8_9BACT|nr:hypothetical protein [Sedimentisphaera salicampi]ARN56973.1 hypothetical protein STSP1_01366 [Sedimentisphaera salicampi]
MAIKYNKLQLQVLIFCPLILAFVLNVCIVSLCFFTGKYLDSNMFYKDLLTPILFYGDVYNSIVPFILFLLSITAFFLRKHSLLYGTLFVIFLTIWTNLIYAGISPIGYHVKQGVMKSSPEVDKVQIRSWLKEEDCIKDTPYRPQYYINVINDKPKWITDLDSSCFVFLYSFNGKKAAILDYGNRSIGSFSLVITDDKLSPSMNAYIKEDIIEIGEGIYLNCNKYESPVLWP